MPELKSEEDRADFTKEIQLRHYQLELIKFARKENSIIFLPTGCGKTFIALNVLKSRIKDLKITNEEDKRKVAVFMGTTRPLVRQLAMIVEENTNLKVKTLVGDMGIDNWNLKTWFQELAGFQVLCLSAPVLLELMQKKIVPLDKISLIVLDECHHTTLNHPYHRIMKEFDLYKEEDWPLVLGLTATVLNDNPKDLVKEVDVLKANMRSTFARTMLIDEAVKFGSCPVEVFLTYSIDSVDDANEALRNLLDKTTNLLKGLKIEEAINRRAKVIVPKGCLLLHSENKVVKDIRHIIRSLKIVLDELGLFPMNLAALFYIIKLERLKFLSNDSAVALVVKYGITILNLIRRKILRSVSSDIINHCSSRVKKLLNFVHQQRDNRDELSCIVLVEQKITAVVLSTLFNEISSVKRDDYFKANYITGGLFNVINEQTESLFERENQNGVILSFKNREFKFLFATSVIEEGVDLPFVNLGIVFQENLSFRVYIQFKGRIRSKRGQLVVLANESNLESLKNSTHIFNDIYEKLLKKIHFMEDIDGSLNSKEDDNEDEIYFLNGLDGPHISETESVAFLIRYCSFLPQDEYACLSPLCWYNPLEKRAFLKMPPSCPIKDVIKGDIKASRKKAKKNVHLKAVKKLHEAKEILDDLSIRRHECNEEDFSELFVNAKREIIEEDSPLPGTNSMKRSYKMKFPENLSHCTPQPGCQAYLHYIKFTAKDERPLDSRNGKFYDLICSPDDFVILSSKPLTKICDFPLFSRFGEFSCSLIVNAGVVTLRASELELIRRFHFFLFNSVLDAVNRLQVLDKRNEDLSFYVVPVKHQYDKELFINWNVIKEFAQHAETTDMFDLYSPSPCIDDYYDSVVFPKYRKTHCAAGYYIVTSLDHTQTPLSEFPVEDFRNYSEYYDKKYQTKILNNSQPLLEAKRIFSKVNYILPRKFPTSKSKRKQQKDDDDFREFLVPELCCQITFPSTIWLKATFLPSALYRITTIYTIDDFRKRVAYETGIGIVDVDDDHKWKPLPVEKTLNPDTSVPQFTSNYKIRKLGKLGQDGSDMQVPIDIFRRITDCAPCDLKHYLNYFNVGGENSYESHVKTDKNKTISGEKVQIPNLNLPSETDGNVRPELFDFVKVFTCKSANDFLDLERLEFLGDAFLKFSVCFYLLRKYKYHEGVLSGLKGNIVGNKNLYYSALFKGLEGPLIVNEFDPKSGWVVPLFTLPEEVKNQINKEKFEIDYFFEISAKEKLAGKLSPSNVKNIKDSAVKDGSGYAVDESFFCLKTISDKSLADCAEALIGLYVKDFGLKGGFAILNWMNILSPKDGSYDSIIGEEWVPPRKDITEILINEVDYEGIEKIIGYEFKKKIILLEALTHPSYIGSATESYQRFEFFGDALIDFMVSMYIYQCYSHKSPGEMTDARIGLVNNVTFACITVKCNLHKYIVHNNESLLNAINHFANYQKFRNHKISDPVMFYSEEGEPSFADSVTVPKALGDVFESLIGAIYLDSGNSLETTWKILYNLMNEVIEEFCQNPPLSPVRLLNEKCKPLPEFKYEVLSDGLMVSKCKIIHDDEEKVFLGRGKNRKIAKAVAAKLALRYLESIKNEPS